MAKRAGATYALAPAVLDAALVARRVAGDAFRLITKDLGGRVPLTSLGPRRLEGQRVHPAEATRRAALGPLAVP